MVGFIHLLGLLSVGRSTVAVDGVGVAVDDGDSPPRGAGGIWACPSRDVRQPQPPFCSTGTTTPSDQMTTMEDGATIVEIASTTRRGCSTPRPDSSRTDLFAVSSARGRPRQCMRAVVSVLIPSVGLVDPRPYRLRKKIETNGTANRRPTALVFYTPPRQRGRQEHVPERPCRDDTARLGIVPHGIGVVRGVPPRGGELRSLECDDKFQRGESMR